MRESTIVERFRAECPDLRIRDKIATGAGYWDVFTTMGDIRAAKPTNPCHCVIARAVRRQLKLPAALVLTHGAYLLQPCGGNWHEVVKYAHNQPGIVRNLDKGTAEPTAKTLVTFRPPSAMRAPGAQTKAQKARQPRARKQTQAHKDARAAGLRAAARHTVRLGNIADS